MFGKARIVRHLGAIHEVRVPVDKHGETTILVENTPGVRYVAVLFERSRVVIAVRPTPMGNLDEPVNIEKRMEYGVVKGNVNDFLVGKNFPYLLFKPLPLV